MTRTRTSQKQPFVCLLEKAGDGPSLNQRWTLTLDALESPRQFGRISVAAKGVEVKRS